MNAQDLAYIQSLGILDSNETIAIFESNSTVQQSGSFISNKRIANYWIEDNQKEISSAYFDTEIDSLAFTDLVSKITYASYITVYKTEDNPFKVYIDSDSARTYAFFNLAQQRLKDHSK